MEPLFYAYLGLGTNKRLYLHHAGDRQCAGTPDLI